MGGVDEIPDVRGAAYMAGQRVYAAREILHFRGGLLEGFQLAAADDDGGAFAGEQFCDGAADAAAGASDDGNLIGETESGCGHGYGRQYAVSISFNSFNTACRASDDS